jgi:ubiquinone/menaquinone biosynthesis C-methylase UbiE
MDNFKISGMDISADMVALCKKNAEKAGVFVNFKQDNVSAMPFADHSFDFIFCSAAFKNFKEPLAALREMHRVLKPGGIALITDANRAVSNRVLKAEMQKSGQKGFDLWFISIVFRFILNPGAYTKDSFEALIRQTPFARSEIKEEGIGLWIYLYKD